VRTPYATAHQRRRSSGFGASLGLDFVGYRCPLNYRSPESIARFIRNTLPFEFDLGNDLPGMGVGVHEYADPAEHSWAVEHRTNARRRPWP
jgi:hypothetical protein